MEIRGTYIKTIERNDFNKWTIFTIKEDNSQRFINCSGYIPALISGEMLNVEGNYEKDGSFSVNSYALIDHNTSARELLLSGIFKGIGDITADAVIEALNGEDIYDYIETHNHLPKTKGITEEKEEEILKILKNSKALSDFVKESEFYGISYKDSMNIYSKYGKISSNILKNKPFKLSLEGFINIYIADKIGMLNGLNWLSDERVDAFIVQALKNAEMYGNTFVGLEQLPRFVSYLCERSAIPEYIPNLVIVNRLNILIQKRLLILRNINGQKRVYLKEMLELEEMAARELKRLEKTKKKIDIDQSTVQSIEKDMGFNFSESQKAVFEGLQDESLLIITGGPGTGKTSTLKLIISYLKKKNHSFVLCAPTGRAAQRLSEVTKESASTIHKLLEIKPYGNDFICKGKEDPIDADFIIVDEMSMVGIEIFAKLLNAVRSGSTIILVGDPDQLQSVQPGNVLQDMLDIIYQNID